MQTRITDLTTLKAAVLEELNRPDLDTVVDTLVQLAEARLFDDYRVWMWYAELAELSAEAPTNALLTGWPQLYFYAALSESAPYLKDDPRLATWEALLDARLNGHHQRKWREDFEAGTQKVNRTKSFGS